MQVKSIFLHEIRNFLAKLEEGADIDGIILIVSSSAKHRVELDMTRMGKLLEENRLALHGLRKAIEGIQEPQESEE